MNFHLNTGPSVERSFEWQGINRQGLPVQGVMRAGGENQVMAMLRRQGVQTSKVSGQAPAKGVEIKPVDIALFTRQLSTMLQAGVPLLQCFDALGRGQRNLRFARLLANIRADVETGAALSIALGRHAPYFSPLYCSLVAAGEAAGRLDLLLERLATHLEKLTGVRFITVLQSVVEALKALRVRRIALATPYDETLTMKAKAGLESYGIEVVNLEWLKNVRSIFDETPARAYGLGRSVDRPEADAVFFSGVGMPTISVLERLERDLGKPVISSAGSMMWNALRVAGVETSIPGYGRLLSAPPTSASVAAVGKFISQPNP